METSYKKTFEFRNAAQAFLATEKDETKLKTALEDVVEQISEVSAKFNKHSTRIRRKHAAEDRNGCILKEENGNYKFTKEGEEKADNELDEMFEEIRTLDIDPVFVDIPDKFSRTLIKHFKGFVFE